MRRGRHTIERELKRCKIERDNSISKIRELKEELSRLPKSVIKGYVFGKSVIAVKRNHLLRLKSKFGKNFLKSYKSLIEGRIECLENKFNDPEFSFEMDNLGYESYTKWEAETKKSIKIRKREIRKLEGDIYYLQEIIRGREWQWRNTATPLTMNLRASDDPTFIIITCNYKIPYYDKGGKRNKREAIKNIKEAFKKVSDRFNMSLIPMIR